MPERPCGPDWSDPRVDTIVPLAPRVHSFSGQKGLPTGVRRAGFAGQKSGLDWLAGTRNATYAPYTLLTLAGSKAHLRSLRTWRPRTVPPTDATAMPALGSSRVLGFVLRGSGLGHGPRP